MTKIRKCPYCGEKKSEKLTTKVVGKGLYAVKCATCGGRGPATDTRADAETRWDKRSYRLTPIGYVALTLFSLAGSFFIRSITQ